VVLVLVVAVVFPETVYGLAALVGIELPLNMVLTAFALFSLVMMFYLTCIVSRENDRSRTMTQQLALLEKRGLFYHLEGPIMEHCIYQIRRLGVQDKRYQAEFYAGATTQLIRAWIHNGFKESPREIAELTFELVKWTPQDS